MGIDNTIMRNYGENKIKEVIKNQGYRTNYVCEGIGVKRATFGHWQTNHTQPSIFQLQAIAELLGVAMEDLIV